MDAIETKLRAELAKAMDEEGLAIAGTLKVTQALSAMRSAFNLGRADMQAEIDAQPK